MPKSFFIKLLFFYKKVMVTTNFAKKRNSLHYALNPKIHFFGKSPADLLAFGHFKNVHFRKAPPDFYEISSFLIKVLNIRRFM